MTMSVSAAAAASALPVTSLSSVSWTMSSAPTAVSAWSRPRSRPAPTTRPAPSSLATWTAIAPALPVAPRMSTLFPGSSGTRRRRATHDDIAGFIAAATFATSALPGSAIERRGSASALSAIVPITSSAATK